MKGERLKILYKDLEGVEQVRCLVEKWTFQDRAKSVGEQNITFSISSENPIQFSIGDYCVYRGATYYLNILPSVDQTAKPKEDGNAFKYDNVRFDSASGDLSRIMMLDITPTTGDYVAAVGTNYTGSSQFQLFCGETRVEVLGNVVTYTAVCTLAGKIQGNLDRAFPNDGWHVHVNLSTTEERAGVTTLVTHTDDKVLSFSNTTVDAALSEVSNTFKLDYFIKGRDIYIGYTLGAITGSAGTVGGSGTDNDYFYFGYGRGYADKENQGKALFEIKKTANSSQQIITRLRAMGSTKNMPYRYYNDTYHLSQSLFPQNLQLPDTFETPAVKATKNIARKSSYPYVRSVLGDINDAYIDKNDACLSTKEGLREGSAQWDGSNQDLEEIYPTIKETTYGELRGAPCADIDDHTESNGTSTDLNGHKSYLNYEDLERIDEILAVGYLGNDGNIIDDAHIGDGIIPDTGTSYPYIDKDSIIDAKTIIESSMQSTDGQYSTGETTLFTINGQDAGAYFIAASYGHVWSGVKFTSANGGSIGVSYRMNIYVTPKSTGVENKIGTYSFSAGIAKANSDTYLEFELPSLPDVTANEVQIPEIRLTETSDVRVTYEVLCSLNDTSGTGYSVTYFVGNSVSEPSTVTNYKSQYRWASAQFYDNFVDTPFHVIIKDLGIKDFKAQLNGNDKPMIVMSDGHCVSKEFEIGDDVQKVSYTKDGKTYKGWQFSLKRASDTSIHVYFPSTANKMQTGDHYMLTGIVMPSVYIKAAEMRLLIAATQYLADNCDTKYTYEPSLDDIYLTRNYDRCESDGDVSKSVYWNLYAGLKFPFFGIPETDSEDEILPFVNISIETITIKEGEGLTPKVEITLNDDIQQTTYQRVTTAVDRIYNGSLLASFKNGVGGISASEVHNLIKNYVGSRYLSKLSPDTAQGVITFLKGINIDGVTLNKVITSLSSKPLTDDAVLTALAAYNQFLSKTGDDKAKGKITFEQKSIHVGGAQFGADFTGNPASGDLDPSAIGGMIDGDGRAELKSLKLHGFLEVPELRYNRVYIQVGPIWRAPGGGYIESVEIETDVNGNSTQYGVITLHLEDGDIGKVAIDDLCMGIYYNGMTLGSEEDYDAYGVADDSKGNFRYHGFFTTYFEVVQILDSERNARFRYKLRERSDSWGFGYHPCALMHFVAYGNRTDVTRQDSKYEALGYTRFLYGVNTWEFTAKNIGAQFGRLDNLSVHGVNMTGYSAYLNNIYMAGHLEQLKTAIESSANYTVDFSGYVDVITVDDAGNVIGGLYRPDAHNAPYTYRINSAISVRKNGTLLTLATDAVGKGTFKIYAEPVNCTCSLVNSTIYITSIDNIKDGVSGSSDDVTFDYDAMRSMESCYVNVTIDCEGKTSIVKKFPVTIKHDSNPYVGADLSNEFSAVSWNTKAGDYIGLPITTDMQMWRNNEALDVTSVSVKDSTGKLLAQYPLADGEAITDVDGLTIAATLETNEGTGKKVGHVVITSMSKDADAVANYNITTTAVYAGISYERTLVHTVNKSTDTNVYRLAPSVGSVTGSRINGVMTLDNTSVSCQVYCDSSDDNHYQMSSELMKAAGLTMTLVVNYKNGTTAPQGYTIGDAVAITQDISTVVFKLNCNSAIYATETIPVLLDGVDGNGVEYVFLWKDDYDETTDNKPELYDESKTEDYQAEGFMPYTDEYKLIQWIDEPSGVGINHPYEFYAQRKFVNGRWQRFGEVKLWSKYPINSSPYILDLTNDNQTVPCDTEGNPVSYQPSEFILFYGSEKISDFADWDFSLVGTNVGYDTTQWEPQAGKYTIMPTGLSSASGTLVLTLTNKSNATIVLKTTMSMAKATAGADAVVYSLVPEGSVIHRNMDGTYDATSFSVQVKMTSGTTTILLSKTDEIQAKELELYIGDHAMTEMYFSPETEVGTGKSVVVTLKHGNSIVDQETIYVISDGKKGTDASAYHLTSDIGALTRDGDGTIKETLPTIGGYVKTGDSDDISVTSGYTIVAEEKNDEGITLDTHTSENGQLTIPSVDDGTTHIVINMYDASNPGVPLCPSQDITVTKPLKGDRGFSGCLQRINKLYTAYNDDGAPHTYHNDASLDGDGIHYIDYMIVKDDALASGWRVYQCIDTHTASATFDDDKAHWTEVGINAVSAFFTYLTAKNASVELLSGSSFVIVENDIPVSGLSNGDIPLWIGALSADKTTAPFHVDKYGSMTANDANLTGLISEGMRQFNRNSFVPVDLSSIKSVALDSYSDAYGVDSVSGSSASVYGTVILPCSEETALGYYKSDADGIVKEYPQSTPSYLKAGTHLSIRNGNGTGYNMWAMLGSQVNAWSNNSALYNLLNHCVLVCADPRVFSLDHQYKLGTDGTYTRSDVAVRACGAYPTNTVYEYNHGCFSANGMRARFILLPPSQALQLISSVERFETYAGGVTGYDNALVWNVLNASDFAPMWCNVQEMLDETVKTGPTRMLTNNYSGDNFDIDAENGFDTYTDALLISKAIATNIGGLNPTLKDITFSIKLYSSPADANSGNTPTWDVTVADA